MSSGLKISNTICKHGNKFSLDIQSLRVDIGEMLLLSGQNGSGKSTLIRSISGSHNNYEGNIYWMGKSISALGIKQRHDEGVTVVDTRNGIFDGLSVMDNVKLFCNYRKLNYKKVLSNPLISNRLEYRKKVLSGQLSKGEKSLLSLVPLICLLERQQHDNHLVLIDEPLANIDVELKDIILKTLLIIKNSGCAVIVSEHDYDKIKPACDKYYSLNQSVHDESKWYGNEKNINQ